MGQGNRGEPLLGDGSMGVAKELNHCFDQVFDPAHDWKSDRSPGQ